MRGATLIVLAWNQWTLTRRCLDSLLACRLEQVELIVVDNGSEDQTPIGLAEYGERLRVIRLPENLGFVRGMNVGIAAARGDNDVVLLNNDLVFEQIDWLDRLRDTAYACADHGIVGCRMRGAEPGSLLIHLGGFIEPELLWGQQTESGRQESDVGQFPRDRRVQGIAFALAYIRRDCLDRIGLLDERFHSYFEDTDYCLRAADAGIASVVAGAVTVRHDQHGSTRDDGGFRERLWTESRGKFAARWQHRLIEKYRGTVLWQGLTRLPQAYGQLTRGLLWRLDARSLRMAYSAVAPELLDGNDFRLELAARRMLPSLPEVALVCAPAQWQTTARGRFRVSLAFSDWARPTATCVEKCNQFDLLLVPDEFQANAFREAGASVPIQLLPLGIDRDYCHPYVPAQRNPSGKFVFLSVAEMLGRDAPDLVIDAFRRSFDRSEPVELIIYICPGNDESALRQALEPLAAIDNAARVRIMAGWGFPAYERAQLLVAADAYVSARRGAGWDPVVREAIACGRIVIAPAYGSQKALIEEWGHAVEVRQEAADPDQPDCVWARPDSESLEWRMRDVFNRRADFVTEARTRAPHFAEINNLDASADRLVEALAAGGTLKPAAVNAPPHSPADLRRPAAGQIVVLGMHRSGTSSVAGLLRLMGAWPGADALLLRGLDNPRGHFEHGEVHLACVRRLQSAGGDWKSPPQTAPCAAVDAFRRELASALDTLEPHRPWFVKEPRLCLLLREMLPLLTRPVFIHVVRDPHDVTRSLQRRDGMSTASALALWEHYTREAFAASAGWTRILIDYDELRERPLLAAARLYDALVATGIQGLRMPAEDTILEWIEPSRETTPVQDIGLTEAQLALLATIENRSILGRSDAGA